MKRLKLYVSLVIIVAAGFLCHRIISNSIIRQGYNNDYAELNNVKYGLFCVDEWKRQINAILADEINKIDLSNTSMKHLRREIETLLNALIDSIDKKMRDENSGPVGWVKQNLMSIFVSLKHIKKGVPDYANAIILELTKSNSTLRVRSMLKGQLEKYFNETFNTLDMSKINSILLRTNSEDIETARIKLDKLIFIMQGVILRDSLILITLSIALFALFGFNRKALQPYQHIFLVADLLLLLIVGVSTPMINLEAKIEYLGLTLMGHNVHFANQILYFQSKSIFNVFEIMIRHKDIAMKLVGMLVITFSVIFPVLKLMSSVVYYFNFRGAKENPVINFFVLKSGKWSMADVMVVAIFMSYIGFNGIVDSQLSQLYVTGEELTILTTNGTALQPGYLLFLAYTLLALFLSGFLQRRPHPHASHRGPQHPPGVS